MEPAPPEFEEFNRTLKKGKTLKLPRLNKLLTSQSPIKKKTKAAEKSIVTKEQLKKGFHVLRKVCYQDMMKPYFKTGNDYRDFQRVWLG